MLPDDVFRSRLAAAASAIKQTTARLDGAADIDFRPEPSRLRLALAPRTRGACPLELMIRADQRYDVEIGSEFYEDCEIGSFDDFADIIGAVSNGDVVTRHHFSAATGSLRAVETVVALPGGREWRRGHGMVSEANGSAQPELVVKDRTFLPYRR